jgi:diguanylate cyclase (GGDEF)-like protein/PAS domain S-box-containing protein
VTIELNRSSQLESSRLFGIIPLGLIIALFLFFLIVNVDLKFYTPHLIGILNTIFIFLPCSFVAYVTAMSFIRSGSPGFASISAGTFIYAIASLLNGWLITPDRANVAVTTHNIGALIASILYVVGTIAVSRAIVLSHYYGKGNRRLLTLIFVYIISVALAGLVAVSSLREVIPPFFVEGLGSTLVRSGVLAAAACLFIVAGALMWNLYIQSRREFLYWYSFGLFLIAIGLIAASFAKYVGGPFSWTGRLSQYVGCAYLVVAVLVIIREGRKKHLLAAEIIEDFLRESDANYRLLLETVNDSILNIDNGGRLLTFNTATTRMFGYTKDELDNMCIADLIASSERERTFLEDIQSIPSGVAFLSQLQARRKDSTILPVEISGSAREASGTVFTTLVIRDISERKRAEEALRDRKLLEIRASTDPLTSVLNRGAIIERLKVELLRSERENRPLSLALLDIDHFKSVNDSYGHAVGDAVLHEVVRRINSALRKYDSLGRFGGEEFLLIVPGVDSVKANKVFERIRSMIGEHDMKVVSPHIRVTVSLGVVTCRGKASLDELITLADRALYQAKNKGRNRVEHAREIREI